MKKSLNPDELIILIELYEEGSLVDETITDRQALQKLLQVGFAKQIEGKIEITGEGRHYYQSKLQAAIVMRKTLGY